MKIKADNSQKLKLSLIGERYVYVLRMNANKSIITEASGKSSIYYKFLNMLHIAIRSIR